MYTYRKLRQCTYNTYFFYRLFLYRGRQLSHTEVGLEVVNRFIQAVEEFANVEKQPKLEGKILYCVLASKIKK